MAIYRGFSLSPFPTLFLFLSFSFYLIYLFISLHSFLSQETTGVVASGGLVKPAVYSRIVKVSRITGNPRRFMRVVNKKKNKRTMGEKARGTKRVGEGGKPS